MMFSVKQPPDLIVDGINAFNSKIMRSTIPWNMFVPRDNTTLAYKLSVKQHLGFIVDGDNAVNSFVMHSKKIP